MAIRDLSSSKLLTDKSYVSQLAEEIRQQKDKFAETYQAIDQLSQTRALSPDLKELKDSAGKIRDTQNNLIAKLERINSSAPSSQADLSDISIGINQLQQKRLEFIDKYDKSVDSNKIDDKLVGKQIAEIKNLSSDISPLKRIVASNSVDQNDPQILISNKDQIVAEITQQRNRIDSVASVINESLQVQPNSDIFKELKNSAQNIKNAQDQLMKQVQEIDPQNPNFKANEIVTQAKEVMKQQEEFVKKYEVASDIRADFVQAVKNVDNLQSLLRNPSTSQDQIILDQLAQNPNPGNLSSVEIQQFNGIKDRVKIIADNFEITFGKKINDALLTGNIQNAFIAGGVPMISDNFQNDQSSNLTQAQQTEFKSKHTLASLTAKMSKLEIKMKEFELTQASTVVDQRKINQEIDELKTKQSNAIRLLDQLNSRLGN